MLGKPQGAHDRGSGWRPGGWLSAAQLADRQP
jgi:hypothetical protein